jgi:hypothetical protein
MTKTFYEQEQDILYLNNGFASPKDFMEMYLLIKLKRRAKISLNDS